MNPSLLASLKQAAWPPRPPARLLIIDDNPSIHRDFELVLLDQSHDLALEEDERFLFGEPSPGRATKLRCVLEHALSGLEGVQKMQSSIARQHPYQLAFVDIRMPGIDGVETVSRLWKLDCRLQVVICTAFADYSWADLVGRLGPADNLLVLKKPFDNIEIVQLTSTLTEKWFLARDAEMKMEEMERLVARRTQQLLDLQPVIDPPQGSPPSDPEESSDSPVLEVEPGFLGRAIHTVEKYLADYEFDVDELARHLGMSRRQLFRKLKAAGDCTPNGLIRTLRLNRAAQLLQASEMTVTEVTYAVGFCDLKHFRTVFREQFGVSPAEYPRTDRHRIG